MVFEVFSQERWKVANVLPLFFVFGIIGVIWSVHWQYELRPLLQIGVPVAQRDGALFRRGCIEAAISQTLTILLVFCYLMSILTHPGGVPDDPMWVLDGEDLVDSKMDEAAGLIEVKGSTGTRRHCKWCRIWKPDRCHHCRVCKTCVLRMDHHCPWIANCVGFRNHKYFFLLALYAFLDCLFVALSMLDVVHRSVIEETDAMDRFLVVLATTLSFIMGFLLALFLGFHSWLMFKGLTTIEFCEKSSSGTHESSVYDRNWYENVIAVLGPMPLLWFVPFSFPEGSGTSFVLNADLVVLSSRDAEDASSSVTEKLLPVVAQPMQDPEWTGEPIQPPPLPGTAAQTSEGDPSPKENT